MKPPPVELDRDGNLVMEMRFQNGSRILGLPQNERTVRIYSEVTLLGIDEASRVADELYKAVTPMLSVSKGQLDEPVDPQGAARLVLEGLAPGGRLGALPGGRLRLAAADRAGLAGSRLGASPHSIGRSKKADQST
jgi:hypothetical protein